MIQKLSLALAALVVIVPMAAVAADLPSRAAPAVFVPPVPAFSWTGAYFGLNAGYSFDGTRDYRTVGNDGTSRVPIILGLVPTAARSRTDGFTGGGQIGYNYEIAGPGFAGLPKVGGGSAAIVAGVEADAAYLDNDKTLNVGAAPGNPTAFSTRYTGRTDFIGTARGRLGIAFGTLLVYATGGFAYGNVNDSMSQIAGTQIFYTGGSNAIRGGGVYGGGVEYALPTTSLVNVFHSSAVTVKAEFLHYDLGMTSMTVAATPSYLASIGRNAPSTFTTRVHEDGNIVRAGLDYKVDFTSPAPIVARY